MKYFKTYHQKELERPTVLMDVVMDVAREALRLALTIATVTFLVVSLMHLLA